MAESRKKGNKGLVYGIVGLVLVGGLIVGPRAMMGKGAPFSEVVVKRMDIATHYAFSGSVGEKDGDLSVPVRVDEYNLSAVSKGKGVTVTVNATGKEYGGKVTEVSDAAVNLGGVGYFTATVDIPDDEGIKPGMTVEARIPKASAKGALTIPIRVLRFDDDDKPYVYVEDDRGFPVKRVISVGINDGLRVQVVKGLGDRQVVLYRDKESEAGGVGGGLMPPMPGR